MINNYNLQEGKVHDHSKIDIVCPTCHNPFTDEYNHDYCLGSLPKLINTTR